MGAAVLKYNYMNASLLSIISIFQVMANRNFPVSGLYQISIIQKLSKYVIS